jgi:hypothetical protein
MFRCYPPLLFYLTHHFLDHLLNIIRRLLIISLLSQQCILLCPGTLKPNLLLSFGLCLGFGFPSTPLFRYFELLRVRCVLLYIVRVHPSSFPFEFP